MIIADFCYLIFVAFLATVDSQAKNYIRPFYDRKIVGLFSY